MTWITLATEDELSAQVGLRLAKEAGFEISQQLRKNGNGYLKSRIGSFCELARHHPVLLITDLDTVTSPQKLIKTWLGKHERPTNFLLRVAVREIESWLLADHDAMRKLLGPKATKLPQSPDDLLDPKRELIRLASNAARDVREDIVVERNTVASQGLGYNARLGDFVNTAWHPERAAERSPSLARTRIRLDELAHRINAA